MLKRFFARDAKKEEGIRPDNAAVAVSTPSAATVSTPTAVTVSRQAPGAISKQSAVTVSKQAAVTVSTPVVTKAQEAHSKRKEPTATPKGVALPKRRVNKKTGSPMSRELTIDLLTSDEDDKKVPNAKIKKDVTMIKGYHIRNVEAAIDDFVKSTLRAGVDGLIKDFEMLKEYRTFNFSHDAFTANMERNRYRANVCLDATRVVLQYNSPPATDYIHANWIKASNVGLNYIATQGPMENTIEDFWRMCYQEKVASILMLCNITEKGEKKCTQYWPSKENQEKKFGIFIIRNKKQEDMIGKKGFIISLELVLERPKSANDVSGSTIQIDLFHLTCWPDAGVPSSRTSLLRQLRQVAYLAPGPCVVHCSAGCGRTGSAIASAIVIDRLFKGVHVRVNEVVKELRGMRAHAVQTRAQYVFIAHLALFYIKVKMAGIYDEDIHKFEKEVKVALQ